MHDDALARAAAELLLEGNAPDSERLVRAVRDAGSDAVLVRALLLSGHDDAKIGAFLASSRRTADAPLRCGVAQSNEGVLVVVAPRGGELSVIDPKERVVRGTLDAGFTKAELVVADAHGAMIRLGADSEALARGIPLPLELQLPAHVQLVAHGSSGPRPVAERAVHPATGQSTAAPPALAVTFAAEHSATAHELVTMLESFRRSRGRLPVRDNRVLAAVAQRHSSQVCAQGRVAHELQAGEDPAHRLRDAGVTARVVGETVARAPTPEAALSSFTQSPSHLLTLLSPGFTDVGIGVARDSEQRACVVVLFAAWPRYVGR